MTEVRTPAEVFPPSVFMREEMEARAMTEREFKACLLSTGSTKAEVLACLLALHVDDKSMVLDEGTARALSRAFDTSPEYWINLDRAWRGQH